MHILYALILGLVAGFALGIIYGKKLEAKAQKEKQVLKELAEKSEANLLSKI
jgi:uncharacterized membrane-anchored protein YhcB (DUF1043 family)